MFNDPNFDPADAFHPADFDDDFDNDTPDVADLEYWPEEQYDDGQYDDDPNPYAGT